MVQAIIWEVLQCRFSVITAETGKTMGGEMHKSRMVEKKGEEGRYGAIRIPYEQLSLMNLSNTLLSNTMGGKRYRLPDQGNENASMNSAPWSGRRDEYLGKW